MTASYSHIYEVETPRLRQAFDEFAKQAMLEHCSHNQPKPGIELLNMLT